MLTLDPSTRVLNPWGSGGLLCSYWEAPAQRQFGIRITCCSHTRQDMWKGCYMTTSFEGFFFFFSEQWVFTDLNTLDFTTCKVPNKATENQIHKQLWRFQIPFHPCSMQRLDGIHSERRKAQLPPLSQNDCVEEIGGSETKPQSRWGMQRAIVEPRKGCLMDERQDGTRGCYGMGGERGVWLTLRVSAGMGEGHWRSVTFREGQQRM